MSGLRLPSDVCVYKLGNEENPATSEDVNQLVRDICRKGPSNKEMLDWLDKNMRGYGKGWICRDSSCGRGLRLHETNLPGTKPTVREAIVDAMKREI